MRLITQITGIASATLLVGVSAFAQTHHVSIPRTHSWSTSPNVRVVSSNEAVANHQVNQITREASDAQITIINDNNNFSNTPFLTRAFETRNLPDSPGLGFDFAHMAAVGRGQTVSIPAGSVSGGFFLPYYSQPSPVIVVQPAPVVVVQPAQQVDDSAERPRSSRVSEERSAETRPAEPMPVRDVGEFVLVRRDGGQVLAVAFTVQKGQISYITRDGVRRSVALSVLDLDATRNENEERGTTLRFPAL